MTDIIALRVYVAVSNSDDRMMEKLGATRVGAMRNAEYSLWYYASENTELPDCLAKWPFIWYDVAPVDDDDEEYYYEIDDEEEPSIVREDAEYARWEQAHRMYEYEPDPDYYDVSRMLDDDDNNED